MSLLSSLRSKSVLFFLLIVFAGFALSWLALPLVAKIVPDPDPVVLDLPWHKHKRLSILVLLEQFSILEQKIFSLEQKADSISNQQSADFKRLGLLKRRGRLTLK